jgi:hypothetical protein
MTQRAIIILILIPALFISSFYSLSGKPALRSVIQERMKTQFVKPRHITCLPKTKIRDKKMEREIIAALIKKYPEVKPDEIIRVVFTMKNWRINRDEFTTFIKSRYIFTRLVITSVPGENYLLELNFMQSNRFMGRLWGEIYMKNILSVDMIKTGDINNICK